jgi:hypothetical protein
MLERTSEIVHAAGLPLHVGGVARIDDASLPIPSDLLNAQYPRLGATGALVSRSFTSPVPTEQELTESVRRFRQSMNRWGAASSEEWELQRRALKQFVLDVSSTGRSLP